MRGRFAAFPLGLSLMIGLSSPGCSTFGVTRVFMALEADGLRPRTTFDVRAENISCIADISSGVDGITLELDIGMFISAGNYQTVAKFEPVSGKGTTQERVSADWPIAQDDQGNPIPRAANNYRCRVTADGKQLNPGDVTYFAITPLTEGPGSPPASTTPRDAGTSTRDAGK